MAKKFILLTGASTGIGRATALELAKNGYTVFAGVRNDRDAAAIKNENIETLLPIILDVIKAEHIEQAFKTLTLTCGDDGLCALINNAGINYVAPFELSDEAKERQLMDVNVFGMINTTRKMIPLLQKYVRHDTAGAKIINVGSIGGAIGLPWEFSYHVSKFAVLGLSHSLRFELAPLGIKVTCVMPGGVNTPIFDKSLSEGVKLLIPHDHQNHDYYRKNIDNFAAVAQKLSKNAMPPEKLARKILNLVNSTNPPLKLITGVDAKVLNFLAKYNLTNVLAGQLVKK